MIFIKLAKITRIVCKIQALTVRFHVKLDGDVCPHEEYTFNHKDYCRLSYNSFVTLEIYNDNLSQLNTLDRSVMITERNQYSVVMAINRIINNLKKDMYAIDNGNLIIYHEIATENIVQLTLPTTKNVIRFVPTIIYDANETSYEGVTMYLNQSNVSVNLTIDDLTALQYVLSRLDFFIYSQSLINYYIGYYKINIDNPLTTVTNTYKQPSTKIDFRQEPTTQSTFAREVNEMDKLINWNTKE